MINKLILLFMTLFSFLSIGQSKDFKKVIDDYLTFQADTIHIQGLSSLQNAVLVDCRAKEEYDVSRIPGAIFFEDFDWRNYDGKTIVVYCSIGKRSEDYSIDLNKQGAKNVFNLYGGIFEWVNQDNKVVDSSNQETEKVHTYSKKWSKWLIKGKAIY